MADYAIARHYPELADHEDRYLRLLRRVGEVQAKLVAAWINIGFIHGVMNTDNMTISGETIDYGPCAFIDTHDPKTVFSSIDAHGRYAYGNQPNIALWNLARLAECLLDLINPDDSDDAIRQATNEINAFPALYQQAWLDGMRKKLGLADEQAGDLDIANDLIALIGGQNVDFTLLFRHLADALRGDDGDLRKLFDDAQQLEPWLGQWRQRLASGGQDLGQIADGMDAVNPIYIPRNHLVEGALQKAEAGDLAPFEQLLAVLADPFTKDPDLTDFALPAPDGFGPYKTFCGT